MIAMTAPYSRGKSAVKYIILRISTVDAPYKRATDAVTSQGMPYNLRANATDNHSVRTATSVRSRGAPVALQETLLRSYGDLTATPLRSYQNAERRRLFCACPKFALSLGVLCEPNASSCDVTTLLRRCLRSYCAQLSVLHFSWKPRDRHENADLV